MRQCRGTCAAGKDELLQRREGGVEAVEQAFEPRDLRFGHARAPGNTDVSAEIEEVVLHIDQGIAHLLRQLLHEQHTDHRIELVDFAERSNAWVVLRYARSVAEPRLSGVARARVDLREAVSDGAEAGRLYHCAAERSFRPRWSAQKKKPREYSRGYSRSLGGKRAVNDPKKGRRFALRVNAPNGCTIPRNNHSFGTRHWGSYTDLSASCTLSRNPRRERPHGDSGATPQRDPGATPVVASYCGCSNSVRGSVSIWRRFTL